jgi:hypothetical protein
MADRRRVVVATALAVLLAIGSAACGDDGEASDERDDGEVTAPQPVDLPPEAEPYVDALTAMFTGEETLPIDEEQARCVASRMVQVFRVDRLLDEGVDPESLGSDEVVFDGLELSEDEGLKLADAFQQCNFDLYRAFVDSIAADTADPAAARRCLEATVSREVLRQAMAESFIGADGAANTAASEAMFTAMSTCTMEFEQIEGEL